MISVVNQDFWDKGYARISFSSLHDNNYIIRLIDTYIKNFVGKKAFEIGCFPGGYLENLAHKGMIISGIDLTPRMDEMVKWLKSKNIRLGEFFTDDILNFRSKNKYDLVCSFGFIEHFKEWQKIIDIHDNLLKKNGYIVITCPNFNSPITWLFHRIFDSENLSKHVVSSMNQELWASYLKNRNFEIIYKGSFGKAQYWFDTKLKNSYSNRIRTNLTLWLNRNSDNLPILNKVKSINGIIARKK